MGNKDVYVDVIGIRNHSFEEVTQAIRALHRNDSQGNLDYIALSPDATFQDFIARTMKSPDA